MNPYNPQNRMNNCGFCAISYALERLGKFKNADVLYEDTLQRLHIMREGNADPIPRQLIFDGSLSPTCDEVGVRIDYRALQEGVRGLSDYTLANVAKSFDLQLRTGDKDLLNAYIEFLYKANPLNNRFEKFAEIRRQRVGLRVVPTHDAMMKHVKEALTGNAIIGAMKGQSGHFVNLRIERDGSAKVIDKQILVERDGRYFHQELGRINLFEQILPLGV